MDELNRNIDEIINHLNDRAKRLFKLNTIPYRRAIADRLKQEDVETIKLMIDYRVAEWWGTEMEKYLTPDTLFRASKFPKYVEYALRKKELGISPRDVYSKQRGHSSLASIAKAINRDSEH